MILILCTVAAESSFNVCPLGGIADAKRLWFPSAENPGLLKGSGLKAFSWSEYSFASFDCCQEFRLYNVSLGPIHSAYVVGVSGCSYVCVCVRACVYVNNRLRVVVCVCVFFNCVCLLRWLAGWLYFCFVYFCFCFSVCFCCCCCLFLIVLFVFCAFCAQTS